MNAREPPHRCLDRVADELRRQADRVRDADLARRIRHHADEIEGLAAEAAALGRLDDDDALVPDGGHSEGGADRYDVECPLCGAAVAPTNVPPHLADCPELPADARRDPRADGGVTAARIWTPACAESLADGGWRVLEWRVRNGTVEYREVPLGPDSVRLREVEA